jgi:FAD/FMN-containing dehydrogenase/Fe-S oxidoreductase
MEQTIQARMETTPGARRTSQLEVDTQRLARDLRRHIEGEVRFDDGNRALYATDASNYRQVPMGVVVPRTTQDVITTVELCRRHGAPITGRGGGTSLAGQCCNVAVIIDSSKYLRRIIGIDTKRKEARVEPGVVLDQLRDAAKVHDLTFGCDTSTHAYCTMGGSIGNNACGVHSVMAGRTSDNINELMVLTYDGMSMRVGETSDASYEAMVAKGGRRAGIYARLRTLRDRHGDAIRARFPKIPRRVSGYNLDDLLPENGFHVARSLVGTEGTCVQYLEATVRLIDRPPCRSVVVLGYPDVYTAADHVPDVLGFGPTGLEGFDDLLVHYIRTKGLNTEHLELLPEAGGWLAAEFGGRTQEEARAHAERLTRGSRAGATSCVIYDDPEQQEIIWEIRESGLGATARVPAMKDTWEGWEDSAVAPEQLGNYLRDLRALFDQYDYRGPFYGHFGQGCVHTRIDFGLKTADGIRKFRLFLNDATDLVIRYGGSYSGEHGDGQSKAEFLPKLFGEEIVDAFREFKAIWDPDNKMNPGKVVDPYPVDENLRLGTNYSPRELPTDFHYPEDNGNFAYAMERCVGVGKCRRVESGTMCPSYMVTLEEMHSTRGRARLLFEMVRGEVIGKKGWRDEHVKESLDLCLSCKACKSECPMKVDMATYKAEFLHHYYRGRLRPRAAYAMGLIFLWARLASQAPKVANFLSQAPLFSPVAKWLGGIARQRRMPSFAPVTFREWFENRPPATPRGRSRVLLWPDTFNNHFHPETAMAAVEVLEAAGFEVTLPKQALCCGRPLYDFGMLDLARRKLRQVLDALRDEIRAGTPVVGIEPSCTAVFRDELVNFFPHDEDAARLCEQTYTLGEFLVRKAPHYELPRIERRAMVHMHCHHRALMSLKCDRDVFDRLGLDYQILDSGCCGMAGAFGFEAENYEVSVKCGERVLLPRVRETPREALIIADGFSCRQQIEQLDGRRALHMAQVLQMAAREGPHGPAGERPEEHYLPEKSSPPSLAASVTVLAAGIAAAGLAFWGGKKLVWGRNHERKALD